MEIDNELMKVLKNTVVGPQSLASLIELSRSTEILDGCIAEVGVYRGGSALLLCSLNPESRFYVFDTFEGMPKPSRFDNTHIEGEFNDTSEQYVRDLLARYDNCFVYKGLFPAETGYNVQDERFKLVHLDVDIHKSYADCLKFFYPRMVQGGIVIMDDYGSVYCLGARKAIDDFMETVPEQLQIGPERQAHFVKGSV